MSTLCLHTSDRDRVCRLCEKNIERGERAIMLKQCKVGNKTVNLHFHKECLVEGLEKLEEEVVEEESEEIKRLSLTREDLLELVTAVSRGVPDHEYRLIYESISESLGSYSYSKLEREVDPVSYISGNCILNDGVDVGNLVDEIWGVRNE